MVVDGDLGRRRSVRRRPRRGAVRRAQPARLRRRARHALGPLSVRRVRRAAAARHLGSRATASSRARQGAKHVAIANAGTIPDRGLYGVFLLGADRDRARVGELDEEMVFEARVGETFLLGASTWRIEQITHDRVLVSPAPGEPGKMPFWKGEAGGRPIELGIRDRQARARAAASATGAARRRGSSASTASTRSRPPTCCSTSTISSAPSTPCPTIARCSSSARATSSATGACSCCRRSAAACTRRGRWR